MRHALVLRRSRMKAIRSVNFAYGFLVLAVIITTRKICPVSKQTETETENETLLEGLILSTAPNAELLQNAFQAAIT